MNRTMGEITKATRPPSNRMIAGRVLAGLLLLLTGIGAVVALPAGGTEGWPQETLVEGLPANNTPHATDGEVRSIAVADDTVVIGGSFTSATDPDRTTVVDQPYLLAFDRNTGVIRRNFLPQLDREVFKVIAAPDGQSVYVGGRFSSVNGVTSLKVARIRLSDGARLPFQSGIDALVTEMALQNGRLIIGGVFTSVQGRNRRVAALDAETGVVDDSFAVEFEGRHRGSQGEGRIWGIEAAPDGQSVLVVGNFGTAGGLTRNQVAKLHTGGPGPVTVSNWTAPIYASTCGSFTQYVTDVAFSPDSSYFVITTTGGKGSGTSGQCDAVARWENTDTPGSTPTWTQYSGGDSYYSAEVTNAAVYVGGHMRWSNNPHGNDDPGRGAVETEGIAALDPANGLPLSWNPGRERGRAVWEMQATEHGLYVGSDTERIAGGIYKGRIAYFPLGSAVVPQPAPLNLPVTIEQYSSDITARSFDGSDVGAATTIVSSGGASSLSGSRAAFLADGVLYTARSNGTLVAQTFDGTTLGAASTVDLRNLTGGGSATNFASDLSNMDGMAYHDGRLYYTRSGSSALYMRYFSTESRIIGSYRYTLSGSGFGNVGNMFIASGQAYYVDTGFLSQRLKRAPFTPSVGIDLGASVNVTAAFSWSTSAPMWARQSLATNQPPTVTASGTCTGMACDFTATASDPDGSITAIAWDFGDGGTASGPTVSHSFGATGGHTVNVTVTDDRGGQATAAVQVTTSDIAPVASFTANCNGATCAVDGLASSDADGSVVSWAWTFGDEGTGTGSTTTHTYTESGDYTIGLTVTDNRGNAASTTRSVSVEVPSVSASFVASAARTQGNSATQHPVTVPASVQTGDTLLLFASSNASSGTSLNAPAGWTRLRDVNTAGSRSAVFTREATPSDAGSTVTVTLGGSARADVVVAAYRNVTVSAHAGTSGYTTPNASAATGDWVVSYWADKSASTSGWTAPAGQVVRHSWANSGAGHVSELLTDSGGPVAGGTAGGLTASPVGGPVSNSVAVTVVLHPLAGEPPGGLPPVASFTASCTNATCAFDGSGSTDPEGAIVGWAWQFGDGTTGSGATTARTYGASGSYVVQLTVTDADGLTSTASQSVTVEVPTVTTGFVVAASRTEGNTATTHAVTVPVAVEAGDVMLLFATSNASATTSLNAPAGWTRLRDVNTTSSRSAVFTRIATLADVGATVTITLGGSARADVVLAAYRNAAVAAHNGASGYTTPTATAATGDWVVSYWADKSGSTTGWTAPAGQVVRHSWANSGAGHVSELLTDSGAGVGGGPVGGLTAAPTGGTVSNAVSMTIVLHPTA